MVSHMSPKLVDGEVVFSTLPLEQAADLPVYQPIAAVWEAEGLTLVVPTEIADRHQLTASGRFRMITLQVHSSLDAYGLTAVFATLLARHQISANVVAGYFHDHIFVPTAQAAEAVALLKNLAANPDGLIAAVIGVSSK